MGTSCTIMRTTFVQIEDGAVDVSVSAFRAELSEWLDRARGGQEIVITERGVPIARVVGLGAESALERLTREGVISRPLREPRPTISLDDLVEAKGSVSQYVSKQRR